MDSCINLRHWFKQPRWFDEGLRETIDLVKEAGFTHVHWSPDGGTSNLISPYEMEFTANMLKDSGLKVTSLHGANGRSVVRQGANSAGHLDTRRDFSSHHEWQRLGGVDLIKNRVEFADAIGSPNIVLHIDISDEAFRNTTTIKNFFEPILRSFDDVMPFCLERGVQIAVETLIDASPDSWISLYDVLFDRFPAEFLGMCFDCGHWNVVAGDDMAILQKHGTRLITTHIHDNFGIKDEHLLPFSGNVNWPVIIEAIARTDYKSPLNLETPYQQHSQSELPFYHRAHKVAVKLEQMMKDARQNMDMDEATDP